MFKNKEIFRIGGRHTFQKEVLYLAYSASYLEFRFRGKRVSATLISDGFGDCEELQAWAAVFVDGEPVPRTRFPLEKGEKEYILYEDVKEGEVLLRLMKYSEAAFATLGIASLSVGGRLLSLPGENRKLIEFIGDSITCGYGIEGVVDVDIFRTCQENPWEAYACRTARLLNWDFRLLSWSGNGIISCFIDESQDEAKTSEPLIPLQYPYADLELEKRMQKPVYTRWEPERLPDLIVINLGTNDSSYTREKPERNAHFLEEYKKFIGMVREKNPAIPIICMLGIMEQKLDEQVRLAVEQLSGRGEEGLYFLKAPLQAEEDGMGTDFHPSAVTHEKMSVMLAAYIKEKNLF